MSRQTVGGEQRRMGTMLAGNHLPALDGLRGVAILLVLLYHFTLYGGMRPQTTLDRLYFQTALLGWTGVDLFFVLSGFLITGILCDTLGRAHFFRNFYARRTLRIFPLYYLTLLVVFVVIPAVYSIPPAYAERVDDQVWYWSYLVNVDLARGYWPDFFAFGHFWSLAVEEQFYLLWPLLIFAVRGRRLRLLVLGIIVAALLLRVILVALGTTLGAYVLMPARCDTLAVGGLIALMAREPGGIACLIRWYRPVLGISAGAIVALLLWQRGFDPEAAAVQTIGFSAVALFFGSVLVASLVAPARSRVHSLLTHGALRRMGRYSYALYIFHHPIAIYLGSRWIDVDSMPRLLGSELPGQALFILAAGAASWGLAWISWHALESPFLRLKEHFPYAETRTPDSPPGPLASLQRSDGK